MQRKGKFVLAIRNHDINEVRRLLCTEKIPVNGGALYRDHFIIECFKVNQQDRMTCRKEDEPKILEMLKLIVQHGADVNVRGLRCSPRGMTAAMISADQGLERCLRFLVESGADLTITADSGDNTLMMAVRAGQVDCVKYLTEHSESGSLYNQVNKEGDNALMVAIRAGQVDCVKYLIQHSVSEFSLNQVNEEGHNALMMAASRYTDDYGLSVKCLLEAVAYMQDRAGRTALMLEVDIPSYWIIGDNDTQLYSTTRVQSLIKGEADLSLQDNEGRNALMIAIERNMPIAMLKLLTENMSVSTLNQVNKEGKTALMLAASSSQDDHGLSVKFLVEAGADVNVCDRSGRTALMLAVDILSYWKRIKNDTELHNISRVQSLIKGGTDLSLQDNIGRNALMIAIERNLSIAILKLLIENMSLSNINQVNEKGQTALILAASNYDHKNAIRLLIAAGADLNVTDTELGYTALMSAIDNMNDMAATLLLEKGALVNTVSRYLETPLSLIRSDKGMITELFSRGLDPALSCRDQGILHTMVEEGKDSVVRGLVMNGFPPVDIDWGVLTGRFGSYINDRSQTTTMSPLALALTYMHHNIARYLIVNHFFTRYDSVHLCGNQDLRQSLQRQIQPSRQTIHVGQWTGDTGITRAKKCLEILDFLSARQLSLLDLCLVTISSALSQYLVRDPQDIPPGDSRWMCQLTFKERVQLLAIPPALKRELLHETSYSCIPCESWGDISLE